MTVRDRDRDRETERDTERDRQTDRQRQRQRDRDRERQRETERNRDRQTKKERDRQIKIETDRQTQREWGVGGYCLWLKIALSTREDKVNQFQLPLACIDKIKSTIVNNTTLYMHTYPHQYVTHKLA